VISVLSKIPFISILTSRLDFRKKNIILFEVNYL